MMPPNQIPHEDFPAALHNFYEALNTELDEDSQEANIRNFRRTAQSLKDGQKRVRFHWLRKDEERGVVQEDCQYEFRYGVWHRHDHTVM